MRYLVTDNMFDSFLTDYFDPENHFNSDIGMVVYDLKLLKYMSDGKTWKDIIIDNRV